MTSTSSIWGRPISNALPTKGLRSSRDPLRSERSVDSQDGVWGGETPAMCACTLHKGRPSSEWSCHWITFILAVSEEASSCKSTHMNLPDSKEDGALPTEVTRTIHLYICIFILTVNVCSRAPHPGWLHFYLSISLLETKAARVDPSPDGISPLSLSRGVSLWCFSFTQQLQHHFRFCFKRLGKKKKNTQKKHTKKRGCADQAGWQQRCECASLFITPSSLLLAGQHEGPGQTGKAFVPHQLSLKVAFILMAL